MQILIAHREARSLRSARRGPEVPAELDVVFQKMVARARRTGSSRWPR